MDQLREIRLRLLIAPVAARGGLSAYTWLLQICLESPNRAFTFQAHGKASRSMFHFTVYRHGRHG